MYAPLCSFSTPCFSSIIETSVDCCTNGEKRRCIRNSHSVTYSCTLPHAHSLRLVFHPLLKHPLTVVLMAKNSVVFEIRIRSRKVVLEPPRFFFNLGGF